MKTTIKTNYGNIVIFSTNEGCTIRCNFRRPPVTYSTYDSAMDMLESLIFSHVLENIDVTSVAYVNGINRALAALMAKHPQRDPQ